MPTTADFLHQGLCMAYRTFGKGPQVIIAFHGFGRTGEDFAVLEPSLGERFTLHAFDLPFHGQSPSPAERAQRPYEPAELHDFFAAFLNEQRTQRCVLLGYSLGGRIALSLLETLPERIAHAALIAPDGLRHAPWYRRLASSAWGRARYRHFIDRPARVHTIVHGLWRLRILSEKMHRFILGQSDTREKRLLLHDVWLSFRGIEPDLDRVARNAKEHGVRIQLIFGQQDRIIPAAQGRGLASRAPEQVSVVVLEGGHQLLNHSLGAHLARTC